MNDEKLIVGATIALVTTIFIAGLTGKAPAETVAMTASSVLVSQTPYDTARTISGYSYGFACHNKTTAAALKATRQNNHEALFKAAEQNSHCFSKAQILAGLK